MSRVFVIEKNKNGMIELTKEQLQNMLDDAYRQGYSDGKGICDGITYSSYPYYMNTSNPNIPTKDSITLGVDGEKDGGQMKRPKETFWDSLSEADLMEPMRHFKD